MLESSLDSVEFCVRAGCYAVADILRNSTASIAVDSPPHHFPVVQAYAGNHPATHNDPAPMVSVWRNI